MSILTVIQRDLDRLVHHDFGRGMQPEISLNLQSQVHFLATVSPIPLERPLQVAVS